MTMKRNKEVQDIMETNYNGKIATLSVDKSFLHDTNQPNGF